MNERIQLLAKQAYEDVIKNTPSFLVIKELYEQKFAELIIRDIHAYVDGLDTAQIISTGILRRYELTS
jgi:hypothetical protein